MTATEMLRKKVKGYIDAADIKSLKQVQSLLEQGEAIDWWDELPEDMKIVLEAAIREGDEGGGSAYEDILEKYSKWFKK